VKETTTMSAIDTVHLIVLATDIAMLVTLATLFLALAKARADGPPTWIFTVPLGAALVWGAAWAFVPALSAIRNAPPPFGQAGAIIGLVIALNALRFLPVTKRYFRAANPRWLMTMGLWRPVYGSALILLGINGGLPDGFFWSAGIGDILVGLIAIWLLLSPQGLTRARIIVWNILGAADLAHVLVLGAITLRPFYLGNPDMAPLNLLPLVGVPLFLALHLLTLGGLLARQPARPALP
jgi:hypothetical protein